ncbi:2OG-Fe(II) oxygenase [Penicillium macrosclerotiorum]|uniref:2OG-Fe(II) oxygenase n=1 Tax=Penicillium macrosclerotiorum TaxID=303699 RepID=UPI002547C96B|nr:2OG-Fe(II) oxygenase [Penicillium macrosclerotiorum]KAJ5692062.1 2OG-Fe(II) oxygenase [Penicillium macrosclerotiorum]
MTTPVDAFLPTIDISRYTVPKSPEDKSQLILDVRDACLRHGFLQIRNHGVPLSTQNAMLQSTRNLFHLPREQKIAMSLKKRTCHRGYEGSGDQLQHEDILPDSKEGFYIGPEEPGVETSFIHGPNVWPELPEEVFHGPVWKYYGEMLRLGRILWEILVQGLGHPFGAGPHTDFGGVTCLLQQPGKDGLEVWHAAKEEWVAIPAQEDVYVVNLGDMIQKWTGGEYKSTRHRVINKGGGERLSVATFWHGDLDATSPLNPDTPSNETVEQYIINRFSHQFRLPSSEATGVH